jgi:Holliday junction resolvase RusA-like endonuclease
MTASFHVFASLALGGSILCATVDAFLRIIQQPIVFEKPLRLFEKARPNGLFPLPEFTKHFGAQTNTKESMTDGSVATGKPKARKIEKKEDKTAPVFHEEATQSKNILYFDRNFTLPVEALVEPAFAPNTKGKAPKVRNFIQVPVEPSHWIVASDDIMFQEIVDSTVDCSTRTVPSVLRFTVRGNPLPLRRHRTSRGFVYNPSAATQKSFRTVVEQLIATHVIGSPNTTTLVERYETRIENRIPLWDSLQPIAVSIVFRMKRPKSHFIANRPGVDRLRKSAPRHMSSTSMRTDVDNLAKFVLDSLNGLVYTDDRQIVSLHVTKLYDNDDSDYLFRGSTCVCIRLLKDDDIPQLLSTSMKMF